MPDFNNDKIFPTFYTLPTTTDEQRAAAEDNNDDQDHHPWFMVVQVKNNMTITKPTLIATDRSGMDFAVTFEEDRGWDLKARGLKKGSVMVIPRARRLEKGPGRKDVLVVEKRDCESVKAIPGSLERTIALGSRLDDSGATAAKCETCEKVQDGLSKCTGCESVAYCGKSTTRIG
ncbi:hypothetical protein G7054_g10621 [Neopestalotiopsis clavispora]|nr:hypothetical protein G7054_g10621 [Neopestalotiopsis clavispora]